MEKEKHRKKTKRGRKKIELKKREERRKNVVIREMKGGKNEMKKEIKEALKEIGVDTDVNCTILKIVQKEVKMKE